jgi:hypothetical protein
VGVVHDFALPFAPGVTRLLTQVFSLTRTFYLIRHADDRRNARLARFADLLVKGVRRQVQLLEAQARDAAAAPAQAISEKP